MHPSAAQLPGCDWLRARHRAVRSDGIDCVESAVVHSHPALGSARSRTRGRASWGEGEGEGEGQLGSQPHMRASLLGSAMSCALYRRSSATVDGRDGSPCARLRSVSSSFLG